MNGICGRVGIEAGGWFENNVQRVVGDGRGTCFWSNNWVGGVPLRVRFPRLFYLTNERWATVNEMAMRGWEDWGWRMCVEETPSSLVGGVCYGMYCYAT